MLRYTIGLLAVTTTLGLAGCASSSAVLVGQARPPITPDQVKLYTQPPKKYQEIAVLDTSSRGSFSFSDQAQADVVVARLKEEAAKVGANGVLLQSLGTVPSGGVSTGFGSGGGFGFGGIGLSTSKTNKAGAGTAIFVEQE